MQKYQKTYLTGAGYDIDDTDVLNNIVSEISGQRAIDIHHIKNGMSGVERQDYPFERLIALTRQEHEMLGDKKQYFDYLLWVHYIWICNNTGNTKLNHDYLPIFKDIDSRITMPKVLNFWDKILFANCYVEIWEMPDHCKMQIYSWKSKNMVKQYIRESKEVIYRKETFNLKESWK